MRRYKVLRYSPYYKAVSEIVRSGTLGELVNVVHVEPVSHYHFTDIRFLKHFILQVGYYHFAHSYVRGKCCLFERQTCLADSVFHKGIGTKSLNPRLFS